VARTDAFYQDRHRRLWQCIVRMLDAGKPADLFTVCEELGRLGEIDKAGGASYIAQLAQNTPSAKNLKRYAEVVETRAVQRKLMQVGTEIAESALRPGSLEIGQLLDEAETKIFSLSEGNRGRGEGPKEIAACSPRCTSASTSCTSATTARWSPACRRASTTSTS
jgi:replicative DNA helicase